MCFYPKTAILHFFRFDLSTMNNQHPILRWFVRICGVRNHRPHTRQPIIQSMRDYPPAFLPPNPNDVTSDGWYCQRDLRREVEPNKSITQIPEALNDSSYPVPGWGSQWTLSTDQPVARSPVGFCEGDGNGAVYDGYMTHPNDLGKSDAWRKNV